MAVYNDGYDNEEERRADLAWEYRKGGPNDPNLYPKEEPEEDEEEEEEEEEVRLIDAEALKKAIKKELPQMSNWGETFIPLLIDNAPTVEPCLNCKDRKDAEYIRHGSSWHELQALRKFKAENERPQGEWIAVKDKYPDKEGEYLVSLENGRIVVADDRSIIENHDYAPKMLAWQPLPEPYCGAGGDPS